VLATRSSQGNLDQVFTASLIASMLVFATPLTFAAIGGMFSERSGVVNIGLEGMMLMGAFWGIWGADKTGNWFFGVLIAMAAGGGLALVHAFFAIQLRADQIVGGTAVNFLALGITGYFFVQLYHGQNVPTGISQIPNVNLAKDSSHSFLASTVRPAEPDDLGGDRARPALVHRHVQDADRPADPLLRRAPQGGRDRRNQRLRRSLRRGRALRNALRAGRGVPDRGVPEHLQARTSPPVVDSSPWPR